MNLKKYFEINHGTGVLATADNDGTVDAAIYSRPHLFIEKILQLIGSEQADIKIM